MAPGAPGPSAPPIDGAAPQADTGGSRPENGILCRSPMTTSNHPLPARRVVVLGASNVMRGLGHVVDAARAAWGSPLDLLVASGYGRSYGTDESRAGSHLAGAPRLRPLAGARSAPYGRPTAALLTDVGNDILYGASVERIVEWVETCLARLRPRSREAGRHAASADGHRDPRDGSLPARAHAALPQLLGLARGRARRGPRGERAHRGGGARFDADVVRPDPAWYGLDPVHVRMGRRRSAWRTIVASWADGEETAVERLSAPGRLRLRMQLPERRRFLGLAQRRTQPATTLPDGSRLSLY